MSTAISDNTDKLYYRPAEAAKALGCCRRTIYNYHDRGVLLIEKVQGLAVISRDQLITIERRRAGRPIQ